MSPLVHDRLVALTDVHNFRDLGGYPTVDGRETRWGRLYRADGLHRLAGDDLEVVRRLGLHTVLDLRTAGELEQRGTFPVDRHPVHFHHLPVIDVTWDRDETVREALPATEFLTRQYRAMLDQGEHHLARALHLLAQPGALPAVFHCAAGKDRTGLLAALVLAGIGVEIDVVAEDYGLSAEAMVRTRQWAEAHSPEMWSAFRSAPSSHLAAEPDAMRRLLHGLRAEHGSIRGYLADIGVGSAVLARLEEELLTR